MASTSRKSSWPTCRSARRISEVFGVRRASGPADRPLAGVGGEYFWQDDKDPGALWISRRFWSGCGWGCLGRSLCLTGCPWASRAVEYFGQDDWDRVGLVRGGSLSLQRVFVGSLEPGGRRHGAERFGRAALWRGEQVSVLGDLKVRATHFYWRVLWAYLELPGSGACRVLSFGVRFGRVGQAGDFGRLKGARAVAPTATVLIQVSARPRYSCRLVGMSELCEAGGACRPVGRSIKGPLLN